jgi:hypothetical protein
MKPSIKHFALALVAATFAGCAPAPLDPAALPPQLKPRLTPASKLTGPKQNLIVGKWDLGDGILHLMRGGHFRLRMHDGSLVIDSTGPPPQGTGGTQRGGVLPVTARWTYIESTQGDRLRFNKVADNPHGYANPNLGGNSVNVPSPRSSSFEFEILFVNDDCMIYRMPGSLGVGRRVR